MIYGIYWHFNNKKYFLYLFFCFLFYFNKKYYYLLLATYSIIIFATMAEVENLQKIVSHCKEYGFIFPSSEIYDNLGAVYDYGPFGVELKNHIKEYWWKSMVQMHENIVGLD